MGLRRALSSGPSNRQRAAGLKSAHGGALLPHDNVRLTYNLKLKSPCFISDASTAVVSFPTTAVEATIAIKTTYCATARRGTTIASLDVKVAGRSLNARPDVKGPDA